MYNSMHLPKAYMNKKRISLFSSEYSQAVLTVVVVALIAAFLLVEHFDIEVFSGAQGVRLWIESFGLWAPLAYIALMTLAIIIVPIPDFIIGLAAGLIFPWYLAASYTLIADFLGSSITFFLGRRFGRPMVQHFIKEDQLEQFDELASNLGLPTIFIMRLIPGFNFDLVGYASGLTPIAYMPYMVVTLLGILPRRIGTYYFINESLQVNPLLVLIGVVLSMIIVPALAYVIWQKKRALHK